MRVWVAPRANWLTSLVLHATLILILACWGMPMDRAAAPTLVALESPMANLEPERMTSEMPEVDVQISDRTELFNAVSERTAFSSSMLLPEQGQPGRIGSIEEFSKNATYLHGSLGLADDGEEFGEGGDGGGGYKDPKREAYRAMLSDMRMHGLDVVLVFDSTGSMGAEISNVKRNLLKIGSDLARVLPLTRISVCTYRDHHDDYLVKGLPLTEDIEAIHRYLLTISAGGGGDYPEAVVEGLRWAIEKNEFRPKARKVILLFGDAPPHAKDLEDCLRLSRRFQQQGGVISAISCRKRERIPAFAEIAAETNGEALFLRDHHTLMRELVVLVFGSDFREEVLKQFQLEAE